MHVKSCLPRSQSSDRPASFLKGLPIALRACGAPGAVSVEDWIGWPNVTAFDAWSSDALVAWVAGSVVRGIVDAAGWLASLLLAAYRFAHKDLEERPELYAPYRFGHLRAGSRRDSRLSVSCRLSAKHCNAEKPKSPVHYKTTLFIPHSVRKQT